MVQESISNTYGAATHHGNYWLLAGVQCEEHIDHTLANSILLILVKLLHILDCSEARNVAAA